MNFSEASQLGSFSIFVGVGAGLFVIGLALLFTNTALPANETPQTITSYTDGVLQKNNQIYDFSFQFNTIDLFAEKNPVEVDAIANLPGVTAKCVKLRFEGAADYSATFHGFYKSIPQSNTTSPYCRQIVSNEIILFRQTDIYQSNQTLTIQYGMNGNWGVWYFNPEENQSYGDYVPNVIHISSADTLVQLHTNRLQSYLNILILALTFIIAGATILQLLIRLKPTKKVDPILMKTDKPKLIDNNKGKDNSQYFAAPTDLRH